MVALCVSALIATRAIVSARPHARARALARAEQPQPRPQQEPRAGGATGAAGCEVPVRWPHWQRYVERFISGDGRVIDRSAGDRTTSEGQAYALFFALVANDRPLFERLLSWTQANLAGGDLARRLPAWHWGLRRDGRWGIVDPNAASDADLWMGYALLEAGRLWGEPRFAATARALLANVAAREVANLDGLGPTLLPGPQGFALGGGRGFRLNPSYEPPQLLHRLATAEVPGPWKEVLASSLATLRKAAPRGVVPDWILYRPRHGFMSDPVHGPVGSYDAVRVYLWVGMLHAQDRDARDLGEAVSGLLRVRGERGVLPEELDVHSLRGKGEGPVGFSAALLPLARARGDTAAAEALEQRLSASVHAGLYGEPPAYYDQNLALFARGFLEGRYRFGPDGALVAAWKADKEGRCGP